MATSLATDSSDQSDRLPPYPDALRARLPIMSRTSTQSLSGRRALIHGGAGAIGSRVAQVFAREGAHVFLAGRTGARVEAVAAALRAAGARAEAAQVDVLDAAAVDVCTDAIAARGGLDIMVNAVAFTHVHGVPFTELAYDDFARPIAAYTRSLFVTAQAAARHLGAGGAIVTLSVPGSRLVGGTWFGNGTTFAAVEAMSRLLAGELGRRGVRVVCLRPDAIPDAVAHGSHTATVFGEVATRHGTTVEAMLAERARTATLLGRLPSLDDVAEAAAFAASPRAGAMTGAILNLTSGTLVD